MKKRIVQRTPDLGLKVRLTPKRPAPAPEAPREQPPAPAARLPVWAGWFDQGGEAATALAYDGAKTGSFALNFVPQDYKGNGSDLPSGTRPALTPGHWLAAAPDGGAWRWRVRYAPYLAEYKDDKETKYWQGGEVEIWPQPSSKVDFLPAPRGIDSDKLQQALPKLALPPQDPWPPLGVEIPVEAARFGRPNDYMGYPASVQARDVLEVAMVRGGVIEYDEGIIVLTPPKTTRVGGILPQVIISPSAVSVAFRRFQMRWAQFADQPNNAERLEAWPLAGKMTVEAWRPGAPEDSPPAQTLQLDINYAQG